VLEDAPGNRRDRVPDRPAAISHRRPDPITGVAFGAAWPDRREVRIDALVVPVIGREALLANERALGRHRDLADIELLEASGDD
jgi:hypothetical protein